MVVGTANGLSSRPASTASTSDCSGFQCGGIATTTPRVWFGCSIATTARPARKFAARNAGGAVPVRRRGEADVGLVRRELLARVLQRERTRRV